MLRVRNFMFHKGIGAILNGHAKFTARFLNWTGESGVALCVTSYGKKIKIPSAALVNFNPEAHPQQTESK